jgi:hypothetical protein
MNLGSSLPQRCSEALLEQNTALLTSEFQPGTFLIGQEPEILRQILNAEKQNNNNLDTKEGYNKFVGLTAEIFMIALMRRAMHSTLQNVTLIKPTRKSPLSLGQGYSVRQHNRHQMRIVHDAKPHDIIAEFELGIQEEQTSLFLDATISNHQIGNKKETAFTELRDALGPAKGGSYELHKMHVLFTDVPREPTFREKKPGVHVLRLALLSQVRELLTHYAPDIPKPYLPAKSSDVQ